MFFDEETTTVSTTEEEEEGNVELSVEFDKAEWVDLDNIIL